MRTATSPNISGRESLKKGPVLHSDFYFLSCQKRPFNPAWAPARPVDAWSGTLQYIGIEIISKPRSNAGCN